jgi:hypothetical protein
MKLKVLFLSMLATALIGSAVAQVENDDMYFNSSDRVKLKEARKAEQMTLASNRANRNSDEEGLNPTDSYSARNVNPEFTSRSQSGTAAEDEEEYFVSNYRYNNASQFNNWNSNFNNWYGSSWYRNNYWGPSIYGWNSPYYGSAYDTWGNPWSNPYYQSGWSSSFSFYYGNSWNYGWGNTYNPYCGYGYDPYGGGYSPYYGYGSYYGSPFRSRNSYYPTYVVVADNDSRGAAYGKRASRSSQYNRETYGGNRGTYSDNGGRDRANTGGRSGSTSGRERTEYYNNSWRNNNDNSTISTSTPTRSASTPTRTFNSGNNSSNTRSSSWESQQRSVSQPSTPTRSFDSTPTRSFDSTPTRSSGGNSSSGGSSGSHSRSSRGN